MKQSFLDKIASFSKYGSGISFERLNLAIKRLALESFVETGNFIVITGTNGKGSTAMMLETLTLNMSKTTGSFTSPHFIEFNERFRHNAAPIEYWRLNETLDEVLAVIKPIKTQLQQDFGSFEVQFLLALKCFAKLDCELLIFEAGIGGRLDPVRLLKPKLTALTSIDLEHTELLGNTTELIGYDKLDACAAGGTVVIGQENSALLSKLTAYGTLNTLKVVNASDSLTIDNASGQLSFIHPSMQGLTIQTQFKAQVDLLNLRTALVLVQALYSKTHNLSTYVENWTQALKTCQIPGRFELICASPEVFVDAAHTPAAYQLLFETIKGAYCDRPLVFVLGLSQGREPQSLARYFNELKATLLFTQAFKGMPAATLATAFKHGTIINQPEMAIAKAKQLAYEQQGRVFVIGGLFLAGTISAIEQGLQASDLYLY